MKRDNKRSQTSKSFYHQRAKVSSKDIRSKSFYQKENISSLNQQSRQLLTAIKKNGNRYPPEFYFNDEKRKSFYCSVIDDFLQGKQEKQLKRCSNKFNKITNKRKIYTRQYSEPFTQESSSLLDSKSNKKNNQPIIEELSEIQEYKPRPRIIQSAFKRSTTVPNNQKDQDSLSVRIISPMKKQAKKINTDIIENVSNLPKKIKTHKVFKLCKSIIEPQIKTQKQRVQEELQNLFFKANIAYENSAFSIGYAQKNGKQLKIKHYKNNALGYRIKQITQKMVIRFSNIRQVWSHRQQSDYQTMQPRQNMRERLFSIHNQGKFHIPSKIKIISVKPKLAYNKLFANNCQEFKDIITSVASTIKNTQGKLINLELCLDNLYYMDQKDYRFAQWGSSITESQICLKNQKMSVYKEPIYEDMQGNWLIHPEYAAPEILQMLIQKKMGNEILKASKSQIWSLGLLIYQLYAQIPVWMPYKTRSRNEVPKEGILFNKIRALPGILQNQLKLPIFINRWIRKYRNNFSKADLQIINLMKQMLSLDISERPTIETILQKIKY